MMHSWTGKNFLERLRCDIGVMAGGELFAINQKEARNGQATLDFEAPYQLAYAQKIDVVVEGCCADSTMQEIGKFSTTFPMGRCAHAEGESPRSWLHAVLDRKPAPKSIVIYPTCCGPYRTRFEDFLRKVFPHMKLIFPEVHDFCENLWGRNDHMLNLAKAFIEGGVLKSQKVRQRKK